MTAPSIALLLLASGLSSRFEDGDKLVATLGTTSVLGHIAGLDVSPASQARIAIVRPDTPARRDCLEHTGWVCLDNPSPERGQALALRLGISHIRQHTQADAVLILLADMPFITSAQLTQLTNALTPSCRAVMSSNGTASMPPALFRRPDFVALEGLTGDTGARGLFHTLDNTVTIDLPVQALKDIDTLSDLQSAEASLDG
ncbi:MAG: nucleotidyltransferase family protein [Hyphomonas sp.]